MLQYEIQLVLARWPGEDDLVKLGNAFGVAACGVGGQQLRAAVFRRQLGLNFR